VASLRALTFFTITRLVKFSLWGWADNETITDRPSVDGAQLCHRRLWPAKCEQRRSRGHCYASPGQLVDVDGFRLNLYCMVSGSPTVVFDSGWGDWAPAWSKVQPEIAKWMRACSYDRPRTGLSDPGPMPRTSVRIAKELHTALHRAGVAGPYILVGSAFSGDNVRTFANLYMDEVAGLVLDDADPVDLEPRAMREESHRGQAFGHRSHKRFSHATALTGSCF